VTVTVTALDCEAHYAVIKIDVSRRLMMADLSSVMVLNYPLDETSAIVYTSI
jgi:hypothetical protein